MKPLSPKNKNKNLWQNPKKMKQIVLFRVIGEGTHGESLPPPHLTSHQPIPTHKVAMSGQQVIHSHSRVIQKCGPKS